MSLALAFSISIGVVIALFCVALAFACGRVSSFDKDEYYRPKNSEENKKESK